ncbi:hypothetical protein ACVWZ4_003817 [Bradyrhizobium sp. USDA 4472]
MKGSGKGGTPGDTGAPNATLAGFERRAGGNSWQRQPSKISRTIHGHLHPDLIGELISVASVHQEAAMGKKFASFLLILTANFGSCDSAHALGGAVRACFSQKQTELDDGISQADVIAKAIVHACRTTILEATTKRHTASTATALSILARELEVTLEPDAIELILRARKKSIHPANQERLLPSYNLGDLLPIGSTRFQAGKCSAWECEYKEVKGDREEKIGVAPSKNYRVISSFVLTHPANETSCRAAVDDYLTARGLVDSRQAIQQTQVDQDPLLKGLRVVAYYRTQKGGISFHAGCFIWNGKYEVQLSETDTGTTSGLIDDVVRGTLSPN